MTAAPKRGRPKSLDKLDQIVTSASELFLKEGFERTSMQRIAESADVSKQTLYSHFKNKEDLFHSCLVQKTVHNAEEYNRFKGMSLIEGLEGMSLYYLSVIADLSVVRMWRLMIASAESQAWLSRLFYEKGPVVSRSHFSEFFELHKSALNSDDFDAMALTYISILTGASLYQQLLAAPSNVSAEAHKAHVARSMDIFRQLFVK